MTYWQKLAATGATALVLLFPLWIYLVDSKAARLRRAFVWMIEVSFLLFSVGVLGAIWTT